MKHLRHLVGATLALPLTLLIVALTIISSVIKIVHEIVYYVALALARTAKAIINFFN